MRRYSLKFRGGKLKQNKKNKIIYYSVGIILVFLGFGMVIASAFIPVNGITSPEKLATNPVIDQLIMENKPELIRLASEESQKSMPIEQVETYNVDNAWGTVAYLPQTHRNPGSDISDPANDDAKIAQDELYGVVKDLHEVYGVNLVMAEGDLYGPVPQNKIDNLAQKITARNDFSFQVELLKKEMDKENINPGIKQAFLVKAANKINSLDREISLEGAPYRFIAEGRHDDIKIYGSENQDTLNESADIVRNYIYEQDRMNQLSGANQVRSSQIQGSGANPSASISALISLLGQSDNSLTVSDFQQLKNQAVSSGNSEMTQIVENLQRAFVQIDNLEKSTEVVQQFGSNTPSRTDNPYKSISSPDQLKIEMARTEQQLQSVVIDKRNKETAENLAKAMKSEGKDKAILQFGAGHKSGLVAELNKQGLNVIVITTKEVAKGERQDQEQSQQEASAASQDSSRISQNQKVPGNSANPAAIGDQANSGSQLPVASQEQAPADLSSQQAILQMLRGVSFVGQFNN